MFLKKLSKTLLVTTLMVLFMVSCEKDEYYLEDLDYAALNTEIESLTVDAYTADLAELDMRSEEDALMQRFKGKNKCFKFVFPLTLIYPDGTEIPVDNIQQFRELMHEWKIENSEADVKPVIKFPFDVELRDNSVQTIENEEQLLALQEECWQNRPNVPRFKFCFDPVFPLNIKYPDGEVVEVNDLQTLKTLFREWKEANPDAEVYPEIQFPIEIINSEGDTVFVQDFVELKEHLRDCLSQKHNKGKKKGKKGNKGNNGNNGNNGNGGNP
jgi:hypothetical protein